jgi:serine/threonine protein phosphatase PrpC
MHAKAVICTPDVFRVPLNISTKRAQRFVVASDGLWDVLSNEKVGELAARYQVPSPDNQNQRPSSIKRLSFSTKSAVAPMVGDQTEFVAPSVAAAKILEHCLHNGGFLDDVTILVVDVRRC